MKLLIVKGIGVKEYAGDDTNASLQVLTIKMFKLCKDNGVILTS